MLLAWLLHEFAIIIASNCCCLCGERQKESLDGKKGFIKKSLLGAVNFHAVVVYLNKSRIFQLNLVWKHNISK